MIHFPTDGWTTIVPSVAEKMSGLPATQRAFGSLISGRVCISTPYFSSDQASLT